MSHSPPEESQHYRENIRTPESPRPLHIPEPSNIPVLANQIDPIFNLMSTHMEAPHPTRDLTAMDHENARLAHAATNTNAVSASDTIDDELLDDPRADDLYGSARSEEDNEMSFDTNDNESGQNQSDSSLNQNHTSLLADQHFTSMASFDNSRTSPQAISEPLPSSTPFSNESSQNIPESYEPSQSTPTINGHHTSATDHNGNEMRLQTDGIGNEAVANGGVNYQTLLENISPANTTAVTGNESSAINPDANADIQDTPTPSTANFISFSGPLPAGLPPRPPPQEKPAIHPNYMPDEDIRSYHNPHFHHAGPHATHPSQQSNSYRPGQPYAPSGAPSGPPGILAAQTGIPPPPLPAFQQGPRPNDQPQRSPMMQTNRNRDMNGRNGSRNGSVADISTSDGPWSPDVQRLYEEFLSDERVYTAEGTWDRFPPGSRLFVGNLPSEVVSKRDIFQIFYRYGKLAQISIKQAYGFVQFLDPTNCHAAMHGEQGKRIKDRNMHLEISKPQKNSRNAVPTAAGDSLRASQYRRSRSPDRNRRGQPVGPRPGADRFVPSSDFRNEPRRRDDYRPGRSPSPRGYRGRDDYRRERSPDRYYDGRHTRSRSPLGRAGPRYRSPTPTADEEATLPIPRRQPQDVPDVQLILFDELDRAFVAFLESSFRERGLRAATLLMPRASHEAVIKRQILEGVLAIVKLYRSSQLSGKIPLQLFDRTGGVENVRFEEYNDLEARVAAELVVREKAKQVVAPVVAPYFGPPQQYAAQPYGQLLPGQQPQQQAAQPHGQPNITSLITSLDGPALQKLLGAMQQNPQTPQASQQSFPHQSPSIQQTPDLSALLGNGVMQQPAANQMQAQPGYPYTQQPPPQQQQHQVMQPQYTYNAPYQAPAQQAVPLQHQQIQHGQHQVQNIMEQLAKWKQ